MRHAGRCNDDPAGVSPPGGPWGPNAVNAAGTGEGPLRDGTDGNTPDPNNPNANRGLHEPTSFYQACAARERNQGLYTADQNLNNNRATRTRQNPNGARSGLECAEERDYYPYWAPSPWQTVMVMTNNLAMCPIYQQESQNVKPRGYCSAANGNGDVPWSQQVRTPPRTPPRTPLRTVPRTVPRGAQSVSHARRVHGERRVHGGGRRAWRWARVAANPSHPPSPRPPARGCQPCAAAGLAPPSHPPLAPPRSNAQTLALMPPAPATGLRRFRWHVDGDLRLQHPRPRVRGRADHARQPPGQ